MQDNHKESWFARYYLWMTGAKLTMGLFFVFFVFMYLLLGLISAGPAVNIDFFRALEMAAAAFLMGILQQIALPDGDRLTKVRSLIWVLGSTVGTIAFSLVFQWFADFPWWCPLFFWGFTALGTGLMIFRYHLKLKHETKRLNEHLEQFQNQSK